ncbi:hypothetical protein [Tateyamaria sp. SN6-1]|uniref:hypothetical protein n=1 Tax=Tateyamaria sp. SN6-1 TaxID=3092148 RepID=UPI0039F5DF59
MRVLDGQVHIVELAFVLIYTVLGLMIGVSFPLVSAIALLFLPLLLIQLVGQGLIVAIFSGVRRWWRGGLADPPHPRRRGVARFIWCAPFAAILAGWVWQYTETGRWFL